MKLLRLLLFPFAILYGIITGIRNLLYSTGVFKSVSYNIPVIAVGNLSTGGTGKTPQIEYLIRLLQDNYCVATLSRGYKRKSKGYMLADATATAETLGDEPYQFHHKFPNISVAVDADRVNGINNLLQLTPKPQVILLDDAYQHRRVKAGFYILLTAYGDIYADDYPLPTGNLREGRTGAKRADVIVVTKCPPGLSIADQQAIHKKLSPEKNQQVFFSFIDYDDEVYGENTSLSVSEIKSQDKLLVAGIAKPEPFFKYLEGKPEECRAYPDHHDFTDKELQELNNIARNKIIVTTEKDYVRLKGKLPEDKLFYLPIKAGFLNDETAFNQKILAFIAGNKRIN